MQTLTSEPPTKLALRCSTTLAALKSHGVPDDDPRVLAARADLAYFRVRKAIASEAGRLTAAKVDLLVRDLMSAAVSA